ncbi:inversin-B [Hydra vulgaris]|uniref:inversin-B n=1 Tax=Hydra vulgaris TaxID=6087 RepID=UPI00064151FD|nr:inversin-B [Hydra vulgaris]
MEVVSENLNILCEKKQLSPLHLLAINGNKQLLQDHLSSGKWNINEVDHMGRTPLIYSILGDQIDCVLLLLKEGASIDDVDIDERTALHWASYQGNHRLVKILLSKGANKTKCDKEGKTPLHFSTSHDNIKVMHCLVKSMKKEEIDIPDYQKMTALCWSVFYGRIDYVKLLLRYGASTKSFDKEQRTLLHWCSENKDASILNILLEEDNTTLNRQDSDNRSALHMYVGQSSYCLVKNVLTKDGIEINIRDKFGRTPLHWAAVLGNTKIVSLLLDNGADYNIGDNNGVRPLQYAAQNNFYETVKIMLEKKGVKDIPDNEHSTALMWAAMKGWDKVLEILLSKEVSHVNAIDIHKQSALHMSTQGGHLNCVKLLIKYGADVNLPDGKQHIPLFYACASGNTEIVNELLKHCSPRSLEECDLEGRCPLHYAAMVDRTDIIKILMQNQPNPNIKDNAGCPPLHFAAYGGFVHCMSVLLENGANVNNQDNEGRTALHWACKSGSLDAVKLLVSRFNAKVNVLEFNGGQLSALDYAYLEDHQDVAFYLTENNAYTGAFLKDFSASKIQAIWKGYKIRKIMDSIKHHNLHNNFYKKSHKSSNYNTTNKHIKEKYCKGNFQTLEDIITVNKVQHNSGVYNVIDSSFENMKSSRSSISFQSTSPKSSLYGIANDNFVKPEYLQGPKFLQVNENPLSLRKSNPSSVISVNLSNDIYKTYNDKTVKENNDRFFGLHQDSKLPGSDCHDINSNILQKSQFTNKDINNNTSHKNLKESALQTLPGANIVNNNYYNKSYSRYGINNESTSNSQFSTNSTSTNEMRSKCQSSKTYYKDISSKYRPSSSNSKEYLSKHRLSNNDEFSSNNNKTLFKHDATSHSFLSPTSRKSSTPTDNAKFTKTLNKNISSQDTSSSKNSSVFFLCCTNDVNSPWSKFKRDQQRITMIRNKIDAAVKIQRFYRKFAKKTNDNVERKDVETSVMNKHIEPLNCIMVSNSGSSVFTENEDVSNDDNLYEVAALVIQLAWREYLKKQLMVTITRYESTNSDLSNESSLESPIYQNDILEDKHIQVTTEQSRQFRKPKLQSNENSSFKKSVNMSVKKKHLLATLSYEQKSPYAVSVGAKSVSNGNKSQHYQCI